MNKISIIATLAMLSLIILSSCNEPIDGDEPQPNEKFETLNIEVKGVTFKMAPVEGGTFVMGAQNTNPSGANYDAEATENETPAHNVTLSNYYIGEHEVSQALWLAVMESWPYTPPSSVGGQGTNHPAYYVNYDDCMAFIKKLNELTGYQFSLPTEAQWEYAAKGGKKSNQFKYSGGNTADQVAWFRENCLTACNASGSKQANELGVYDMSGNVNEWCSDYYAVYSSESSTNPKGPSTGETRVVRGGSKMDIQSSLRCTHRKNFQPSTRNDFTGFRLVLIP